MRYFCFYFLIFGKKNPLLSTLIIMFFIDYFVDIVSFVVIIRFFSQTRILESSFSFSTFNHYFPQMDRGKHLTRLHKSSSFLFVNDQTFNVRFFHYTITTR